MTFKKTLGAAVAGAAMLAIGGVGTAHAVPSYGYANLNFFNFTLSGLTSPGVTINGTPTVLATDGANYPGFPTGGTSTFGNIVTGVDVPQATSGSGPFPGANIFTQQLLAASGTRGDGVITGAIGGGATSQLVSEGNLTTGPGAAGSNSGSSTTLNLSFTVTTGTTIRLTFDANNQLNASVGQAGDAATALDTATYKICNSSTNVCVNITDNIRGDGGTTVSPVSLNQTVSTTDPAGPQSFTSPLLHYDFSADILPGTYQLTLSDATQVILSTVPEPVSIALLGSGMFALGMIRRRKKA